MKLEVQLKEHSYPIWIGQKALSHIADYIDPGRRYASSQTIMCPSNGWIF